MGKVSTWYNWWKTTGALGEDEAPEWRWADIVVFKPPTSARSSSVSKKHLKHIRKGTDDFIQLIVKLENMMVSK